MIARSSFSIYLGLAYWASVQTLLVSSPLHLDVYRKWLKPPDPWVGSLEFQFLLLLKISTGQGYHQQSHPPLLLPAVQYSVGTPLPCPQAPYS